MQLNFILWMWINFNCHNLRALTFNICLNISFVFTNSNSANNVMWIFFFCAVRKSSGKSIDANRKIFFFLQNFLYFCCCCCDKCFSLAWRCFQCECLFFDFALFNLWRAYLTYISLINTMLLSRIKYWIMPTYTRIVHKLKEN